MLQEAKWLLDEGLQPDEKCAARAIGYRQAMAFLQRCMEEPSHISAANLVTRLAAHFPYLACLPRSALLASYACLAWTAQGNWGTQSFSAQGSSKPRSTLPIREMLGSHWCLASVLIQMQCNCAGTAGEGCADSFAQAVPPAAELVP